MRREAVDHGTLMDRRRGSLFVLGAIFVPSLLIATARRSIANDMDSEAERIVSRDIQPMLAADGSGGVAAAIRIGGKTLFLNQGFADRNSERSITSDTLFNVASICKLFEATLVAQGVLRGELSLDEPVSKYLGELQGAYIRRVTVGELATHTSGLLLPTDHPPWPNDSYSFPRFIDMLNAWTPQNGEEPGKQRIYTHAGYILLQVALERRYGMPIGALIEGRILKPLGMNSTLVPQRGPDNRAIMSTQFMHRTVQGYSFDGKPIGPPGNQQSYYDFPGTGQMFSSARDLAVLARRKPRRRADRSAATGRAGDDATRGVSCRRPIRAGDGVGNQQHARTDDRGQAGRPQQRVGLCGARARAAPRHRDSFKPRRHPSV